MATGDKKRAVMTTDIDNGSSTYPVLSPSGDGSDVEAAFTAASTRTNISTGEKLGVIFGKIAKWFTDLGDAAFRGVDSTVTASSTNLVESGGVKSAINNITPTSESIGSGHTLIRCGNLRILKIIGFMVGYATITIPVSDRPTSVTSGVATYSDSNEKYMTFGLVVVNTDGSIAYKNWAGYNADVAMSDVSSKWINCPGVIWMTS